MNDIAFEFTLDMTEASSEPETLADFVAMFDRLAPVLERRFSQEKVRYVWTDAHCGRLRLTLIQSPIDVAAITQHIPLAIHSVIARPRLRQKCPFCPAEKRNHAPFLCSAPGCNARCCDEHVTILDGARDPFCPRCIPTTASGERPAFWCLGPNCTRAPNRSGFNRARRQDVRRELENVWPDSQRRRHPRPEWSDAAFYCHQCYEDIFGSCSYCTGNNLGPFYCEFVTEEGGNCTKRMCANHLNRWQIYGPQADGLCLCEEHRDVGRLSAAQIFMQLAVGTARRNHRVNRLRGVFGSEYPDIFHSLPTLHTIQHIFFKRLRKRCELQTIRETFDQLSQSDRVPQDLARLIQNRHSKWQSEIERDDAEKKRGEPFFDRALAELRLEGLEEFANQARYKAFKGETIFVDFDDSELRRRFRYGKQLQQQLRQIERRVGKRMRLERQTLEKIFATEIPTQTESATVKTEQPRGLFDWLRVLGRKRS